MSTTNKSLSPENNVEAGYAGPNVFDGFRYARLRELPGLESKHQAASTGLVSSLSVRISSRCADDPGQSHVRTWSTRLPWALFCHLRSEELACGVVA